MNELATKIAKKEITEQDLIDAKELIDRATLISEGITACKKTILFPLTQDYVRCYYQPYSSLGGPWYGKCRHDGLFILYLWRGSWLGDLEIGRCDISNFNEVFRAFDNEEIAPHLERFLREQIEKANL